MNSRLALAVALAACALIALFGWLVAGRARGQVKRLGWRVALLALAGLLVWSGRGLFLRSSVPFALLLAAILLLVVVGQLYSVRFCGGCGRMVRNFRRYACPRCGLTLPRHGFTSAPRAAPRDPIAPRPRRPASRASDRMPN